MLSAFQKYNAVLKDWLGKRFRENGIATYECVAWAKLYCKLQGTPIGGFNGSAINAWNSGSPFDKYWNRVKYIKGLMPSAGDVVFFAPTPGNKYGHVAIAGVNSTTTKLEIIEQNYGQGDGDGMGGDEITIRKIPYTSHGGCVGWFHNTR